MSKNALAAIERGIAALTYDYIARLDPRTDEVLAVNDQIPLLHRSIAQDLRHLEGVLGCPGKSQLAANATAIDEALLAMTEARAALIGEPL